MSLLRRGKREHDEDHERYDQAIEELEERTNEIESRLAALDPEWDVIARERPRLKVMNDS